MVRISFGAVCLALSAVSVKARYVFYYDQWHQSIPNNTINAGIDHVITAFANSSLFTTNPAGEYEPFENMTSVRSHFDQGTKVMIAVGGWGDTAGFSIGAATEKSRKLFAANIAAMLEKFGFDGVDIDWEYPGGNGADYRQVPNSEKVGEIEWYPLLLEEIRSAIGPDKLLTIATPAKSLDMLSYTPEKAPSIWKSVDWVNVMTYDIMNRRDDTTNHHTSVKQSLETIDYYINTLKLDPKKINLGFAIYSKWFTVDSSETCETGLGCKTKLLEAADGSDTGLSGAVTFGDLYYAGVPDVLIESDDGTCGATTGKFCAAGSCCSSYGYCGNTTAYCSGCQGSIYGTGCMETSLVTLFQTAMKNRVTDEDAGGEYYFDKEHSIFWTWDTPELIERKFTEIVAARGLGGVMAWSLGEDSHDFSHILALQKGVAERIEAERKEVESKEAEKKSSLFIKPMGGRVRFGSDTVVKSQGIVKTNEKGWFSTLWSKIWGN